MSRDEAYYFHQTPETLAVKLIDLVPLVDGDVVYEPFRGEGSFYNNFPAGTTKLWTELVDGQDYRNFTETYDWVITNPPFRLQHTDGTRTNSFWLLLEHFTNTARKGVAFLGNDNCFSALTPLRIQRLRDRGWYIQSITVCSVKRWRGRYFFIVLTRTPSQFYTALDGHY